MSTNHEHYKKYINIYNLKEWSGLLYIHTFHAVEFHSTLDESLQLFDEMLWVKEYTPSSITTDNNSPDTVTTNINRILTNIANNTIDWNDSIYIVGKQFVMEVIPEYHTKIDRALDRIKETEMLVSFYGGTMENNPQQQERMQIYLEDDLSDYYSVWQPDNPQNS